MLAGCPNNATIKYSSENAINFHPLGNQGARREQGYDTEWRAAIGDSTAGVSEISEEKDYQRVQPG